MHNLHINFFIKKNLIYFFFFSYIYPLKLKLHNIITKF
jgi:hypothetical protein